METTTYRSRVLRHAGGHSRGAGGEAVAFPDVAVTDPVDIRLLAALADLGKAAVHELAAKVGMDPREVAYRLVALSGSGLPLLVGVESDPNGLRAAIASSPPSWAQQQPQQRPPAQGSVQGTPSGPYNVQGTPSGPYNVHGTPSGRYPGPPSAPVRQPMAPPQPQQRPPAPQQQFAAPPMAPADPVMSTWGVPQTASWARGDEQQPAPRQVPEGKKGKTGDVMETQGLEGEQLTVQLLEVQDPADYLFSAAGYSLEAGERSVVVHTEITNRGNIPFVSLPDNYLELLTADGKPVTKAPVSLTSRPPHKIGVRPGETLGGHTVYVLPDTTRVVAVRWSPRPEPDERTLTWSIDD